MDQATKLHDIFKNTSVLTLKEIMDLLGRSRTSVIRYLNQVGYYASYNHCGLYYTLRDIPKFDSNGIWKCDKAFFSAHGSLRDTATAIINNSNYGCTHDELREILGIRMFDTLNDLVNDKLIMRQNLSGQFTYFSLSQSSEQIEKRQKILAESDKSKSVIEWSPRAIKDVGLNEIIEVLVAFIDGHSEPNNSYNYLHRKGINITPKQVQSVFSTYDLGKKN
jgi:hypothetical protein